MSAGLIAMLVTAFLVFAVIVKGAGSRQRPVLPALAKLLGGQITASNTVRGAFDQIELTYSFVVRGSGSSSVNWTEITAAIPAAYPLAIYLHPTGWFDRGKIERGEMTDVVVGDAAFDDKFVVEAAPASVIRELFDARVRRFLLELGALEIETVPTETGRGIKLAIRGWVEDLSRIHRIVEEHARFASRVREAFAAAAPEQVRVEGAPFREALVVAEARPTDPHREEVARVEARRLERLSQARLFWGVITALLFIGCIALAVR